MPPGPPAKRAPKRATTKPAPARRRTSAIAPIPLPELDTGGVVANGLHLTVDALAGYDAVTSFLQEELGGTEVERAGRTVRIDSLRVFGIGGGRLALEVVTSGDVVSRLFLAGTPRLDPATGAARIRAFFTDPSHARRGLARRILERCESEARAAGFRRMELMALLSGVALYAACGYRAMEPAEVPLPNGAVFHGVRMERALG